jgi:acyl-CoA synthetase (AMP-forming)/AMP-acid ligase II
MPTGQIGEVQARTARLMKGYWKQPDDTAEVLIADGWFRTGEIDEIDEIDEYGYLLLRDRLKDTIISGSELIRFARNRLAGYKCPTAVDFVAALPRNATGKVLHRELREPYWNGHDYRIN